MAIYQCTGCEYTFDEDQGDAREGYAAGTAFASLAEGFTCPDCGVRYKEDFVQIAAGSNGTTLGVEETA